MNNTVTFETAVRLKEEGFPQPEPEAGQFWCNQTGETYVVVYAWGQEVYLYPFGYSPQLNTALLWREKREAFFVRWTFDPTATDILQGLPNHCLFKDGSTCEGFICYKIGKSPLGRQCYDNPAEAAAAAWLAKNEKKLEV